MLSITKISALKTSALTGYFERTAGASDYYESGGEPPGQWYGKCAEKLGFQGEFEKGELKSIMTGFNPKTGEALVKNAGTSNRAAGWDCTFSAPKSVSAAWALANRDTQLEIQKAHDRALQKALDYLEREAVFARRGHAGAMREDIQGIIAATYQHATNRNGDPTLHTHAVLMNVAQRMDRSWGGIDLDTRHKMLAGALYRAELAENLREAGFEIEKDGDSFAIKGVPAELCGIWSSRHEEIVGAMKEKGATSYEASKAAAVGTRASKGAVDRRASMKEWQKTGKAHGFTQEHVEAIREAGPAPARKNAALGDILDRMTEKNSTFSRLQLETEIAKGAVGSGARSDEIHELTGKALQDEKVVTLEKEGQVRYSTREMVVLERHMIEIAKHLDTDKTHLVSHAALGRAMECRTLSDEQKAALAHVTATTGGIAAVEGWAGTGKSYMLDAARAAWEAEGLEVRGAALSGKAAEGLQQSAKIESQTIHSLLAQIGEDKTRLSKRTVLVVDEAGMVGSRQLDQLVSACDSAGAKLVLVGDSKQLQPVDAGGAFKAVAEEFGKAEMSDVRRQIHEADRGMAKAFREGRAGDALENLEKRGRLYIESDVPQAKAEAVLGFIVDVEAGMDTVILAASRADVRHLNALAREEMKEGGFIGKDDVRVQTAMGARDFAEADRIVFTCADKSLGVRNGTLAQIDEITDQMIWATTGQGKTVVFDHRQKNAFDHAYAMTAHKGQGATFDTVHVYANDLSNQEWTYSAVTRAREETRLYTTQELAEVKEYEKSQLEKAMARSAAKDTTLEYRDVGKGLVDSQKNNDARSTSPQKPKERGAEHSQVLSR